MAGSFGYKREYCELSVEVGEELADQRAAPAGIAVATGPSCQEQLAAVAGERPPHPMELLVPNGTEQG